MATKNNDITIEKSIEDDKDEESGSPEPSHIMVGDYVALMETNEKEYESWYYFIKYRGNEEALRAYDIVVQLDQLRFANRLAGRLADQKSVVNFREHSRDALAYAMADRIDQLAFLTMSGVSYGLKNNGALRNPLGSGQNLSDLAFSSDVSAPTTNRHRRWDATSGLVAGDVTATVAADVCTLPWVSVSGPR